MRELIQLKLLLDSLHPSVTIAALVACIWAAQYAVRKWLPAWVWESMANLPLGLGLKAFDSNLRKAWQAGPSVASGAVLTWLSGGGDPWQIAGGALLGLLAPVLHEVLKALPFIPYRGATKTEPPK